jgi:hypothetical protein
MLLRRGGIKKFRRNNTKRHRTMTVRCGGKLLLNSPKIGWKSASPRRVVGKGIDLNK